MKNIFMFLALFAFTITSVAQEKKAVKKEPTVEKREKTKYGSLPERVISAELVGRGGLWSINFDMMVTDNVAVGAGFGTVSISTSSLGTTASASATFIPIYANYYFSESNHRFFATGGADVVILSGSLTSSAYGLGTSATGTTVFGVVGAGYEFRGDDWFVFRLAPYLFIGSGGAYFTGGLSLGYAF